MTYGGICREKIRNLLESSRRPYPGFWLCCFWTTLLERLDVLRGNHHHVLKFPLPTNSPSVLESSVLGTLNFHLSQEQNEPIIYPTSHYTTPATTFRSVVYSKHH